MLDPIVNTVSAEDAVETGGEPYATPWHHLQDELQRLDLRLAAYARAERDLPADPLQQFRQMTAGRMPADAPASDEAQSLRRLQAQIATRVSASTERRVELPLLNLRSALRLTGFEEQCLVAAIAPNLDSRYEALYASLQGGVGRTRPTVGLLLDLLCESPDEQVASRVLFDPQRPLMRSGVCLTVRQQGDAISLVSQQLAADDRVVDALLGRRRIDARLDTVARLVMPVASAARPLEEPSIERQILEFLQARAGRSQTAAERLLFHLSSPPGAGELALVESVCARLHLPLVIVDLERLLASSLPIEDVFRLVARETLLLPAALCLRGFDALAADAIARPLRLHALLDALEQCSRLTFLLGRTAWVPLELPRRLTLVPVGLPHHDIRTGVRDWEAAFAEAGDLGDDLDAAAMAGRFRLGPGAIRDGLTSARRCAAWRSPANPTITMADVIAGFRSLSAPRTNALARTITPTQTWDDLVLPPDEIAQLQEMCDHVRYRHVVLGDWGFERKLPLGRGLTALFTGPPGTGKTMAAQVIASELQVDVYQIDLSQVVSKYIGETEKNLASVFADADANQAILFFDEADALFGKRSEVKDAHDRYANIELGYLLQRMEEYEGVAILATNLRQNLDDAFVRRLRFIVEFPFPDEAHRRRLWDVTLPREVPIAEDVDFGLLARELKLAGGNIKNIALAAAFRAASESSPITMTHLLRAARREQQKLGRSWTEPASVLGGSAAPPR